MSDADDSSNEQEEEQQQELPRIEEPTLDPQGRISQRTVEQRKKQENLVKQTRRLNGNQSSKSSSVELWLTLLYR